MRTKTRREVMMKAFHRESNSQLSLMLTKVKDKLEK